MNESTYFTAKDIERYHSGLLPAAERHALEKAALDDPFLADALEGYAFTTTPSEDSTSLQQRLQKRIEEKKDKGGVFFMNSSWMKVAALFIVFAGAGWLVLQTFSDKTETVAVNQPSQKQIAEPTAPAANDSIKVDLNAPLNNATTLDDKKELTLRKTDNTVVYQSGNTTRTPPPVTFSQTMADSIKDERRASSEMVASTYNKFRDSVTAFKSTALARQNNAGEKETRKEDTIENFDVVLKRSEMSLEETVVISKGAKPGAKKKMQMIVDTLEPAEGWNNFDDYIASNLKQPSELKAKPVSGAVELSFDVNKEGEPVNITVTKSLCDKCDEEAIRLLKEGPKWKKKAKKGKVKIKF